MEQAVQLIRDGYDAFNRGDYDAAADKVHPDVQFHRVAEVETALSGRGAVRQNMTPDVWEHQEVKIEGIEVIGEHVVLDTTFHAVGANSGIELNQDGYHLWRIKDGKGAEFRFFLDRDEAVAAASSE